MFTATVQTSKHEFWVSQCFWPWSGSRYVMQGFHNHSHKGSGQNEAAETSDANSESGRRSGAGSEPGLRSGAGQIPSVRNMIETSEANSEPGRRSGADLIPSMRDMIEASEEEAFETESEEDVFSDISDNKLGADG